MKISLKQLDDIIDGDWLSERPSPDDVMEVAIDAFDPGRIILFSEIDLLERFILEIRSKAPAVRSVAILQKQKISEEIIRNAEESSVAMCVVKNHKAAAYKLAAVAREQLHGTVIAVTGTAGKTTTVSVLGQVARKFKPTYFDEGNKNLLAMTAECLISTPTTSEVAVFEVAAMPDGMVRASELVKPHVVIFTGTGAAHLSYMHSRLIVADVKSQLFFALGKNGTAVINRDDRYFERIQEAAVDFGVGQILTYGEHPASSVRLEAYKVHENGTRVSASVLGERYDFNINQQGKHWATTVISVLAVASSLKIPIKDLIPHFEFIKAVRRRGELLKCTINGGDVSVINDTFNANPMSMRNAVATLSDIPVAAGGRRIMVLGDMLSLGSQSEAEHISLAKFINESKIDLVFCVGNEMRAFHQALNEKLKGGHWMNQETMVEYIRPVLENSDFLLVKGSWSMRLDKTVALLTSNSFEESLSIASSDV